MVPFVLEYSEYELLRKFLMVRFRPESEAAARKALPRVWGEYLPKTTP